MGVDGATSALHCGSADRGAGAMAKKGKRRGHQAGKGRERQGHGIFKTQIYAVRELRRGGGGL